MECTVFWEIWKRSVQKAFFQWMQYPKPPAFHLAQSTITPALFSRQSKPHLAFHTAGSCQNIIVIIEKKTLRFTEWL